MHPIHIAGLTKTFGKTAAVAGISLEIPAGSLFFLLGPSGCGKTTLLRMIAGFTEPTGGTIRFGDQDVTRLPANKRNCGMVFQSYALWPHMTVTQNVAFGLEVRKVPRPQIESRVAAALERVHMTHRASHKPNELSGGQQQRVALARALVIEPTVLLLDEPLSNLDAKLRLEMRSQIRQICKDAKITAVYVTHDQKEALSMADGMAVLQDGKIVQSGDPRSLYDRPLNRFVADFLGETNFIPAKIVGREADALVLQTAGGMVRSTTFDSDVPSAGDVTLSIRPEAIQIHRVPASSPKGFNTYQSASAETIYLGEMAQHQLTVTQGLVVKAFELNPRPIPNQTPLVLSFSSRDVVVLKN